MSPVLGLVNLRQEWNLLEQCFTSLNLVSQPVHCHPGLNDQRTPQVLMAVALASPRPLLLMARVVAALQPLLHQLVPGIRKHISCIKICSVELGRAGIT